MYICRKQERGIVNMRKKQNKNRNVSIKVILA
jgi:hypothetical protein